MFLDFLDLFDSIHRISLVLNEIEGYHRFVGEKLFYLNNFCLVFEKKRWLEDDPFPLGR